MSGVVGMEEAVLFFELPSLIRGVSLFVNACVHVISGWTLL